MGELKISQDGVFSKNRVFSQRPNFSPKPPAPSFVVAIRLKQRRV